MVKSTVRSEGKFKNGGGALVRGALDKLILLFLVSRTSVILLYWDLGDDPKWAAQGSWLSFPATNSKEQY